MPLQMATDKQGPECVFNWLMLPVRLAGDLCTKLMNVHLVLHMHNISGRVSLGMQLSQ